MDYYVMTLFPEMIENCLRESVIGRAVKNGITFGYDDGTFAPGEPCTRLHLVTFLCKYDSLQE